MFEFLSSVYWFSLPLWLLVSVTDQTVQLALIRSPGKDWQKALFVFLFTLSWTYDAIHSFQGLKN